MHAIDAAHGAALTVTPGAPVGEVAKMMTSGSLRAVVVEEAGRPAGIVTPRDLVSRVMAEGRADRTPVGDVMTRPVVTLSARATIPDALDVMRHHGVRQVPLVDEDRVVAMLRLEDLVVALSSDLSALLPDEADLRDSAAPGLPDTEASAPFGVGTGPVDASRHCPCGSDRLEIPHHDADIKIECLDCGRTWQPAQGIVLPAPAPPGEPD
jgi:predicted transcriptional regulator